MAQTFGTFKSMADQRDREAIARAKAAAANAEDNQTPIADAAQLPVATHQERVNAEMFKAMEMLGRKIDRAFDEREHLMRRLALIESAASVDEKTGKLYLPVVAEGLHAQAALPAPQSSAGTPRWMIVTTLLSTAIAVAALALVALRPAPQTLTAEQLAILDALAQTRMGALTAPLSGTTTPESWQPVESAMQPPQPVPAESAQETAPQDQSTQDALDATAPPQEVLTQEQAAPEQTVPEQTSQDEQQQSTAADSAVTQYTPEETTPAAVAETPAEQTSVTPQETPAVEATAAPQAKTEEAPVALTTPVVKTETKTEEQGVEKQVAKPATIADSKPAPVKVAADTPDEPAPLVAGLDIGRDAKLSADLISLETRAMEGNAAAQHDLATLYASGKNVTQDYKRAAYWFAQAADGGIANAAYNLGVMFQQGLGLRKDATKAMDWYKKAADLGHPEAMYNLGIAYIEGVGATRNVDKGIGYFERAAKAGVAQAAYNLGVLYESGFAGPIDLATARMWYENADKQGHADARDALARLDKQLGQAGSTSDNLTAADMVEPAAGSTTTAVPAKAPAQKKSPIYKNDLVGKVQRALIGRGLLPDSAATGVMDARTEDAIRAFQATNKLKIDGIPSLTLLGQINKTTR